MLFLKTFLRSFPTKCDQLWQLKVFLSWPLSHWLLHFHTDEGYTGGIIITAWQGKGRIKNTSPPFVFSRLVFAHFVFVFPAPPFIWPVRGVCIEWGLMERLIHKAMESSKYSRGEIFCIAQMLLQKVPPYYWGSQEAAKFNKIHSSHLCLNLYSSSNFFSCNFF